MKSKPYYLKHGGMYHHPTGDEIAIGNRGPLSMVQPPDPHIHNEVMLYLGRLTVNGQVPNPDRKWWQFWKPRYIYQAPTENWTKNDVQPINFTFGAHHDRILKTENTHVSNN